MKQNHKICYLSIFRGLGYEAYTTSTLTRLSPLEVVNLVRYMPANGIHVRRSASTARRRRRTASIGSPVQANARAPGSRGYDRRCRRR